MLNALPLYFRVLGAKGVAAGMIGKLSGQPRIVAIRAIRGDGLLSPIFLRVPSTDAAAYEQIFLQGEYDFEVARPPAVIVDAGANIGLASIYFAIRYPSALILAIECEKSNFEILKLNVKQYGNVIPIQAALWKSDGELRIVDPGLGKWGFMTAEKSVDDELAPKTRALTLKSIMRDHEISHIDILKVDIEGAELEVFGESLGWIDSIDTIIAELHDRLKPGCERVFANATADFAERWSQGENIFVSRRDSCVVRSV